MSVQETKLAAIADAIRDRDGTTAPIPADGFPERIRAIPGGIELQSVAITAPPAKTSYLAGEAFDPAGMAVTATYSNGATLIATGYAVEPAGPLTDGTTEVTVWYTEGGVTASAVQPVTVIHRLLSISIETPPDKTEYRAGEVFDPAGMAVLAAYSDGGSAAATDYTVPTAPFTVPGAQQVTVTYTENGVTASAQTPVTVARIVIEAIPSQLGSLTYTGEAVSPEWENYDPAQLTIGGTVSAVNAGEYAATFTPTESYQWSDGGTGAKSVVWSVGKAAGSLSIYPEEITLDADTRSVTVLVDWAGDGILSATSSDPGVAVVSVVTDTGGGGQFIVYSVDNGSGGGVNGSAVITVSVSEGTNHRAASGTVPLTASFVKIYGAEWDGTATTKLARTDAAALFADPVPAVSNGTGSSPFDDIMPWAGMKRVTDAQAGELVEIPRFWYKLTKNGDALKIQIAAEPVEGFSVSPAHMDRGDGKGERDKVYVGRYHCASTYKSATKVKPVAILNRTTARTNIHKLGATIWQNDFAMRVTIWLLYLVEFSDWDSQKCIGYGGGYTGTLLNMGNTDAMQYHTGTSLAKRDTYGCSCQYRWIEGLWDNCVDLMDGYTRKSGNIMIVLNPNNFTDSNEIGIPIMVYSGVVPTTAFYISTEAGFPMFYIGQSINYKNYADKWSIPSNISVVGGHGNSQDYGMFHIGSLSIYTAGVGTRLMKLPDPS